MTTASGRFEFDAGFETLGDPSLEAMLDGARRYCQGMADGQGPPWLSLLGPSGCGKTHLAQAVAEWARKNIRVYQGEYGVTKTRDILFADASNLAAKARQGDWNAVDRASTACFLALDDVGATYDPNGFVADLCLRILNQRQRRWTVVTSNLYARDIADRMDTRIASRLFRDGSQVIEATAPDYWLREDRER